VKKFILIVLGAAFLVFAWYLFVRKFEFEVNFSAKTLPGDIIQSIRIWDNTLEDAQVANVDSLTTLKQKIHWNNRTYEYTWNFNVLNDSTTQVNIAISEPGRSIRNKLLIPFTNQPIEMDAKEIVDKFYGILKAHLEITDVKVFGEGESPSAFCVCRTLKTEQTKKAYGMMKQYPLLTSFISQFNLKPTGPPIVKVREWSHTSGTLDFDFCFPIEKPQFLPTSDSVTYQEVKSEKALKAVYHGNYITSDRAWYELIRFAQQNDLEIAGQPIEYFHNNPNLGLNERQWKAEIYLPIK
jgi:hypothetical protein